MDRDVSTKGERDGSMSVQELCAEANRHLSADSYVQRRNVNPSLLRYVACKMAECGMEMTKPIIEALTLYLSGASLFLLGNTGTGKSSFWKVLSKIRVHRKGDPIGLESSPFKFAFIHMPIIQAFSISDVNKFLVRHETRELVVDDVCTDDKTVDYGKRIEMLAFIVAQRDTVAARTHFTSNIGLERVNERYGERVLSRMSRAIQIPFNTDNMRISGRAKIPITNSFDKLYLAESFVMFDRTVEDYDKAFRERFLSD